ncbi:MAG: YARHG domain-containing protein [Lachnospiraceae bacterium]|nr:YARHG domain-containing protein [Candidatus Darwinimomas equi]
MQWYAKTRFDDRVLSEIEKENLKAIKECEEEAQ